ncbi:MAG: site-specific integrase [Blastocatellia bacterium]
MPKSKTGKSVRKRGDSWHLDKRINGTRYRQVLPGARTQKQAEQMAAVLITEIVTGAYHKRKAKTTLESFIKEKWLPWSKDNKQTYQNDVSSAKVFCRFFRGKALCDIAPFDVERFKQERSREVTQRGAQRSQATVNRELAQLSSVFRLAVDNGYVESNPCRRVRLFTVMTTRDRVLSHEEEQRLIDSLTGAKGFIQQIATVGLNTGMRLSEILTLEWSDVDLEAGVIHVRAENTKTKRRRNLPVNQEVRDALLLLPTAEQSERRGRVFEGAYASGFTSQLFALAADNIGLDDVTFYTLRHTFATRLKDAGVDPFTISNLMGHSGLAMTSRYVHASSDKMAEAVKRLEKDNFRHAAVTPLHSLTA